MSQKTKLCNNKWRERERETERERREREERERERMGVAPNTLTLGSTSKATPPPRYKGGASPWVFVMLQILEKNSPLVESL